MIFVDTNVWMYAVGRQHPLREPARQQVRGWVQDRTRVVTSAEVLHELLHAYLPVGRLDTMDAAIHLATSMAEVWPLEVDDVALATELTRDHPGLGARDLAHVAICLRRQVDDLATFDRGLRAAFDRIT